MPSDLTDNGGVLLHGGLYSNYFLNFMPSNDENSYFGSALKKRQQKIKEQRRLEASGFDLSKPNVYRVEYIDLEKQKIDYRKNEVRESDLDADSDNTLRLKAKLIKQEVASGKAPRPLGVISENERKRLNENLFTEKVLEIKKRDLDKELDINLVAIKREKDFLIEKYLEYQARNFNLLKQQKRQPLLTSESSLIQSSMSFTKSANLSNRKPKLIMSSSAINFKMPSRDEQKDEEEVSVEEDDYDDDDYEGEKIEKQLRSIKSAPAHIASKKKTVQSAQISSNPLDEFRLDQQDLFDKFKRVYDVDYDLLPDRLKLKTPNDYSPYLNKIKEKFVEQQLKHFPTYLKVKKPVYGGTKTLDQLDKLMGKIQILY